MAGKQICYSTSGNWAEEEPATLRSNDDPVEPEVP
jgi:hypothetical protein